MIATKFINEPGSSWETLVHWSRLRSAPETDLHEGVRSLFEGSDRVDVVEKVTYSSLNLETLEILEALSPARVLICGIATDGCVLKTAVDVFEKGLIPIVLADLCASHAGDEIHKAGLLLTGRFIGRDQLVESNTILN